MIVLIAALSVGVVVFELVLGLGLLVICVPELRDL